MLDLEAGKRLIWTNRTPIHTFRISDQYLFTVAINGVITAWNIYTLQKSAEKEFHLDPVRISVAKDIAVITTWVSLGRTRPIYVWDLRSNHVNTVGSFSNLCLNHADVDENVLVAFEIDWDLHPPEVEQTKWTLTSGRLLHRKRFPFPLEGRHLEHSSLLGFIDKMRTYGHKTVTQLSHAKRDTYVYDMMHLTYDYSVDKLSFRWIEGVEPMTPSDITDEGFGSLAPNIIYRWTQQFKGITVYNAATGTTTKRRYQLDMREVSARMLLSSKPGLLPSRERNLRSGDIFPSRCCGDREVYCVVGSDGVQLWFFNPDFVPDIPDAVPFLAMEDFR
ncbi:hypothetical protein VTN49DRAFT_5844 [Thermomyces lanuginosus]|uniref:uncharacterized protein n=1 Tax=Thermomyces lanuginosus TaxID=5541 RepID=UPI0037440005